MDKIGMIGFDTAKSVFQIHGMNERGDCMLVRRLKRKEVLGFFKKQPSCTVAMEACSASHYWGREIAALGHAVKLVPPRFVKRFNDGRRKTDARDAKALGFAGRACDLRPVPVKSEGRQAELLTVKVRGLLVRQRTQAGNSLRSHLGEFGLVARAGDKGLETLIANVEGGGKVLPDAAIAPFTALIKLWRDLGEAIAKLTADLMAKARGNATVKRLMDVPGVGPVTAMVFNLQVDDPGRFACGRNCAAWLGLVPNEHSSGGKRRPLVHDNGAITKAGNEDLRSLLVLGAAAVLIRAARDPASADPWIVALRKRRPFKVAATAIAARNARTLWALLKRGETCEAPQGQEPCRLNRNTLRLRKEAMNEDVPCRNRMPQTLARSHDAEMATSRTQGQDTPNRHCASQRAGMMGDLPRGSHLGPKAHVLHSQRPHT